ncbi:MAG: type I-C CRISPR-associated protein Cas7/Csd2 [Clostridia bacterium]|nr:type I-C CRISPR-associated protein Cas7/Csd2 [Clostridia bacterium]
MSYLSNKVDFAGIIRVKNANPNGDPLNGNRPRVTLDGLGELSDVCIKRKIRNRVLDSKIDILVQSDDYKVDGYKSIRERVEGELKDAMKDEEKLRIEACKKWYDVRAFGQVFAFSGGKGKGKKKEGEEGDEKEKSVSIGIRGPVSIHPAFSIQPVNVTSIQITKSVNNEGEAGKKSSDTMGMKHRIDYGVYVFYGSINPQLASKTGFSKEDAEILKTALLNLFENDASTARPEGSMEVYKLYWWEHDSPNGKYSSAKVHNSLKVTPASEDWQDVHITLEELEGLRPEVLDGR